MTWLRACALILPLVLFPVNAKSAQGEQSVADPVETSQARAIADVLLTLGDLYRKGSIRVDDGEFAMNYYLNKSVSAGRVYSVIRPSDLVEVKVGLADPDLERARKAYEVAAGLGSSEAYLRLSDILLSSVPADTSKAFEMVQKAKEMGSEDAPVKLGLMMVRGTGIDRDVEGGLRLLNDSAEQGSQRALMALGDIYLNGMSSAVDADPELAFGLYRKAADLGNLDGVLASTRMMIFGQGVPADPDSGLALARELAMAGLPGAHVLIGDVLAEGVPGFVGQNVSEAYSEYVKAGELGSLSGVVRAAMATLSGTGTKRDVKAGLQMLENAAANGSERALIELAEFYGDPDKSAHKASPGKARAYAQAAARMGNVRGKLLAAKFALEGRQQNAAVADSIGVLRGLEAQGVAEASLILAEYYAGDFPSSPAADQNQAFRHLTKAAESGSKSGLLRASLMQIRGEGTKQNFANGLAKLEELADEGQVNALIAIGDLHAEGDGGNSGYDDAKEAYEAAAELGSRYAYVRLGDLYRTKSPVDVNRAVAFYEKAAKEDVASKVELGSGAASRASALTRLGDLYFEGRLKPYDPVTAARYYSEAAELGSEKARVRIAEMTVGGQGTSRNVQKGLAQLHALAGKGSVRALISLGDILGRGYAGFVDPAGALEVYEAAAAKGDIDAMMRLAEIYRFGSFAKKDPDRALGYLKSAADAGSEFALLTMAKGLVEGEFNQAGSTNTGKNLLKQAESLGAKDAGVTRLMLGLESQNASRSIPARLDGLQKLAEAGDLSAALKLVAIYREGHTWAGGGHTRKNTARARQVLDEVAEKLPAGTLAREEFLLDVLGSPKRKYTELYGRLQQIAPEDRPAVMRRVLRANTNAFLYFAQLLLKENNLYKGQATGQLDRKSIRAINAFCSGLNASSLCRNGPLSPPVTQLLSHAFGRPGAGAERQAQLGSSKTTF